MSNNYNISPQFSKNRFFLVNLREIEERLDPFFYRPDFRNLYKYKIKFQKLSAFTRLIYHPPEYERIYSENGYQLLRAQNVRPTGIELDNNKVYFSEEFLNGKNLIFPEIGDVLVVRSGVNAGDTAVIERKYNKLIIGADNLLIKLNDKIIPKFLQVFFFTAFGKNLMSRYLTGATNKHINPFNLAKIPIPDVSKISQESVIKIFEDVLLNKKENEAKAEKLLASIDDYLLNELGITLPETHENTLKNRLFSTSLSELSGNRYDPFFHQGKFIANIDALRNCKYSVKPLREIITSNLIKGSLPKQEEKEGKNSVIQINCINADGTISLDDLLTATDIFTKEQMLKIGDLLVVITGATIGKIAQWTYDGEYFLGGDIIKFQINSSTDSGYIFHILRSTPIQTEIKRNITGATNGHLSPNDVEGLPLPIPPLEKQKEIADHITVIRQQAQQLKDKTKEALAQASKEIERILLG